MFFLLKKKRCTDPLPDASLLKNTTNIKPVLFTGHQHSINYMYHAITLAHIGNGNC